MKIPDLLETSRKSSATPALGRRHGFTLLSAASKSRLSRPINFVNGLQIPPKPLPASHKGGRGAEARTIGDDDETQRRRRSSANRTLTVLKAALNRAWRDGRVSSDAAWRRVEPFESVDAARVHYLTLPEAGRLINASDPDFRLLVKAALLTGARYGELIRLQVHDFNSDSGTLAIRQSKTGKPRHVILTDEGIDFFGDLATGRAANELILRKADGNGWNTSHQARPMLRACAAGEPRSADQFSRSKAHLLQPRCDERRAASGSREEPRPCRHAYGREALRPPLPVLCR